MSAVGLSVQARGRLRARSPFRPAAVLTGAILVLCTLGLAMVLSASSIDALQLYGTPWAIFAKQTVWMAFGVAACWLFARVVPVRTVRRLAMALLVVTFGLLAAVLVPGVGVQSAGAARWIGFGSIRLQPSELMKLALIMFAADLLARRSDRIGNWRETVKPLCIVAFSAAGLVILQPDMGTTIVLVCILLGVMVAGGVPAVQIAAVTAGTVASGTAVAYAAPYRRERMLSFLHPFSHASSSGYQVVQSLVALGEGRVFGVGLGASTQKWGFLPNDHTDFIFAVIGQELGMVGSLLVLGLFALIAWAGLRIAWDAGAGTGAGGATTAGARPGARTAGGAHEPAGAHGYFARLAAVGITVWIVVQAIINIGAVIGGLPVTGIPLPLVSFGGSSLLINMAALGILLAIARESAARPVGRRYVRSRRVAR